MRPLPPPSTRSGACPRPDPVDDWPCARPSRWLSSGPISEPEEALSAIGTIARLSTRMVSYPAAWAGFTDANLTVREAGPPHLPKGSGCSPLPAERGVIRPHMRLALRFKGGEHMQIVGFTLAIVLVLTS